jgi:hypothetical protein
MTRAAAKTLAAADAVLDWLSRQSSPAIRRPRQPTSAPTDSPDVATATTARSDPPPAADAEVAMAELAPAAGLAEASADRDLAPWGATGPGSRGTANSRQVASDQAAPLRLAHTDWLHHRLTITGPPAEVAAFEQTAAGAGVIPWQLDLDRLAEDLFHMLVAPPAPHRRSLSAAGARILAEQLRAAVARRHDLAIARVGRSLACPFDLQSLIPVPADLLLRGPDDPAALAWLWTHWGTTQALRHVTAVSEAFSDDPVTPTPGEAAVRVRFWSADWTPWRALAQLAARWPALRFAVRPRYDAA